MFDFGHYQNLCLAFASDDKLFANFRNEKIFRDMYEHVTYEQGLVYIDEAKKSFREVFEHIELLANDRVGNPIKEYYEELGFEVAPTTLRYLKVLADLIKLFGSLDGMDIVEIGAGYGGQCRMIHQMFTPKSYTIIDIPEAAKLIERYLREFAVYPKAQFKHYDLFISNYAFTEVSRVYQDMYKEKFIDKSDRGYITCNFYTPPSDMLTFNDILKLKDNYQVFDEIPKTAPDNFIYVWHHK
jgi:hypothetical protein